MDLFGFIWTCSGIFGFVGLVWACLNLFVLVWACLGMFALEARLSVCRSVFLIGTVGDKVNCKNNEIH